MLAVRLFHELGSDVTFSEGGRGSELWAADQVIASHCIYKWLLKRSAKMQGSNIDVHNSFILRSNPLHSTICITEENFDLATIHRFRL